MLLTKYNKKKWQRIRFIGVCATISLAALLFIIFNFRDNIVFFYSPSELPNVTQKIANKKIIRVGGLVKDGSILISGNNLQFVITDLKSDLIITYAGIKPDLFREKQGVVAKGFFDEEKNIFIASELLSKHDEKYMPPEVKKAIDRNSNTNSHLK